MFSSLFGSGAPTCPQLNQFISKLQDINSKTATKAKNIQKYGQSLYTLVDSQASPYAINFEKIRDLFANLAAVYEVNAQEQARAIDDFNDIAVRYPILLTMSNSLKNTQQQYDVINTQYKEIKEKCKNDASNSNMSLYHTKKLERVDIASKLVEETEKFMDYRNRFNNFAKNRSMAGWTRFSDSLRKISTGEADLLSQLAKVCQVIRDGSQAPQQILEQIENTKAEIENNPLSLNEDDLTDPDLPMPKIDPTKSKKGDILVVNSNPNDDGDLSDEFY